MRHPNAVTNLPKDEAVITPTDNKQLINLGIEFTNNNVSVDMYVTSDQFIVNYIITLQNLVTLNQICDYTNGNLFYYKNFRMETHYKNLYNQVRRNIIKETAWESVMRTRFSRGIRITSFITPTLISNEDLMVLPLVDR